MCVLALDLNHINQRLFVQLLILTYFKNQRLLTFFYYSRETANILRIEKVNTPPRSYQSQVLGQYYGHQLNPLTYMGPNLGRVNCSQTQTQIKRRDKSKTNLDQRSIKVTDIRITAIIHSVFKLSSLQTAAVSNLDTVTHILLVLVKVKYAIQ